MASQFKVMRAKMKEKNSAMPPAAVPALGFMLDVSRGRVPTMPSLFRLADRLRLLVIARKEGGGFLRPDKIILPRNEVRAGSAAPAEVVFKTGFFGLFGDGDRAGAHMTDARGDLDDVLGSYARHKRPEVPAVPLLHLARDNEAGIVLFGQFDIGIGLIVL